MKRVLLVDDEPKLLKLLSSLFREHGFQAATAGNARDAEELLGRGVFDLLITDVRLPRRSGIDLLKAARDLHPDMQVIVISAYGTVSGAVEAMRLGAFDYLLKPFDMEGLLLVAQRALEAGRLLHENRYLRSQESIAQPGHRLVARSSAMGQVARLVEMVATKDTTVLLLGESGVGKELLADCIHRQSPRNASPLIRVNCPAIPRDLMESELFGHVRGAFTGAEAARKGKFELADGGTLFLDEIGDLPLEQQGKLLHVLEERRMSRVGSGVESQVDVRILAATNKDLAALVADGLFRSDLYYRLNVFPISIPPLRQRADDIPLLVEELLERLRHRFGRPALSLDEDLLPTLQRYSWPGNVRELRNVLERGAVLCDGSVIGIQHLPPEILASEAPPATGDGGAFADAVEHFKRVRILEALEATNWRKKDAAARLGLTPRALSHYLKRFHLEQAGSSLRQPSPLGGRRGAP